jgi:hypothetical protein
MIKQKPIKVKCVNPNSSTKLIKNGIYELTGIYTHSRNRRTAYIKNVGSYSINSFETLNGESLKNISDFFINTYNENKIDEKKDYTGQFVKCRYSSSKSLKKGEIYYVENQFLENRTSYYNVIKFKIRGIRNRVNSYNFEEIPQQEQRNIKLKNLAGQKIKTGEQTRKFLLYTEQERIYYFLETLSRVVKDIINTDTTNSDIDIIDMVVKRGNKHNMRREDIEKYMKKYLSTTLKSLLQ